VNRCRFWHSWLQSGETVSARNTKLSSSYKSQANLMHQRARQLMFRRFSSVTCTQMWRITSYLPWSCEAVLEWNWRSEVRWTPMKTATLERRGPFVWGVTTRLPFSIDGGNVCLEPSLNVLTAKSLTYRHIIIRKTNLTLWCQYDGIVIRDTDWTI